jgi:hypothetical protein
MLCFLEPCLLMMVVVMAVAVVVAVSLAVAAAAATMAVVGNHGPGRGSGRGDRGGLHVGLTVEVTVVEAITAVAAALLSRLVLPLSRPVLRCGAESCRYRGGQPSSHSPNVIKRSDMPSPSRAHCGYWHQAPATRELQKDCAVTTSRSRSKSTNERCIVMTACICRTLCEDK